MSTSVIEPGTRLAGRYRLEERISDSGGSTLWKAIDEILARAVAVRTFEPDFPRIAEVVTSARAASRLTDPRLTQVFDADDSGENAYVVSEWVVGETLEQMLTKAPLEPGRAATLLFEAAEAISTAHAAGLAHLCLTPRDLVWTTGGTVKLLGIATDAVLADCYSDDPAAEDVRGLGGMLYAALTAHWPGAADRSRLPAAPETDGVPHAPRQVQAGISHPLNAIACRALGVEVPGQSPITTPAELAQALRGVPRTPLPLFAGLAASQPPPPAPPRQTRTTPAPVQPPAPRPQPPQPRQPVSHRAPQPTQHQSIPSAPTAPHSARKPISRGLMGIGAAALTVILGLGIWAISNLGDDDSGKNNKASIGKAGKKSEPARPTTTKLNVVSAKGVEERWMGGPDSSIDKNVDTVHDGAMKPVWQSQTYNNVNFGNLERGVGVLLDMGGTVKISKVEVTTPEGGASIQLRVGDSESAASLPTVGRKTSTAGSFSIVPTAEARGRYVVVWFSQLPSSCKAKLSEVTVYGSKA
ncbi:protein kinase family protein [Actinomadura rudentiformis]|uniref:AMP-binding protein n=1 Tax=Actinomadura rudentiformis TaxID=359158 RepID=A0A6H9YWV3_9ACTN|nr:protein kinase family protein [Actinomadura rudentiformis]KAB2344672.1 AMP-binding protein [Actinomadura rudentiformis]